MTGPPRFCLLSCGNAFNNCGNAFNSCGNANNGGNAAMIVDMLLGLWEYLYQMREYYRIAGMPLTIVGILQKGDGNCLPSVKPVH